MAYRKPTEYVCPSCKIKNMDDTCDGFYECDECGHIISDPTKDKRHSLTSVNTNKNISHN